MVSDPSFTKRPSAAFFLLAYLVAALVGSLAMVMTRSLVSGFTGADEPSHYLNAYFFADYLQHHFGTNPMAAATEFYIHYPKISIGHWPPAYYGIIGMLFMVLPPTIAVAFTINMLVSVLPALGVALALALLCNRVVAVAGVVLYAMTPLVLEGCSNFMVDQPLTACVVGATVLWIAYVHRPGWVKIIGFAMLAALAILIKGNGGLIVLVPVFHIVLTGNWRLLRSIKPYCAAMLLVLAVVPWYILTAKIAADGFNYKAGIDYALKALAANLLTLAHNLSVAGMALALLAIVVEFRGRRHAPLRWNIVSGLLSLILATLALQSAIPVDIVDRYMAPALPAVLVLAVMGAYWLLTSAVRARISPRTAVALGTVLWLICVAPGVRHMIDRVPKADIGLDQIANQQVSGQPVILTVIDGSAGAEGAFIANRAVRDVRLQGYAVRASKLLAESNFMGSSYSLKYATPQAVAVQLHKLGVQQVVIVRQNNLAAYPHSQQLRDAVAATDSGFILKQSLQHRFRPGVTEVYAAVSPMVADIAAVRGFGTPSKVSTLTKLQN